MKIKSQDETTDFAKAISIYGLTERLKYTVPTPRVWRGITEKSFGYIFGPSKSGKSIICENLAMAIASGQKEFMGTPIGVENRKVLYISLEEYWEQKTERNEKQLKSITQNLSEEETQLLGNNFILPIPENFPRYFTHKNDWAKLESLVKQNEPGVVFIDSLSRLYLGNIENSDIAQPLSFKLRELQNNMGITLIVIHHCPKQNGKPITLDSLAGSRFLAQEADFAVGINRTFDKKRYIKDVFYRYAPDDSESVIEFKINDNLWCVKERECPEESLLQIFDGRYDNANRNAITATMRQIIKETRQEEVGTSILFKELVRKGEMSNKTLHETLKKLQEEKVLEKQKRGVYKLIEEA